MNKLKNVSIVPEGEGFQVVGNYRLFGETRFDDEQYKTIIMFESMNYTEALSQGRSISKACPCGLFDIVALNASTPFKGAPIDNINLDESFASLKRAKSKTTVTYNHDKTVGYVPLSETV